MKIKLLLSGVLGLIAMVAMAQPENPLLRREMQQFYTQVDRSMAKGDLNAVSRTLDPSFVYVDTQGRHLSYSQARATVLNMRRFAKNVTSSTSVKHVAGTGNEAYAWIEVRMSYMVKDGRRWRAMTSTRRFADTLKRSENGWRTTMTQELPIDEPWMFGAGR